MTAITTGPRSLNEKKYCFIKNNGYLFGIPVIFSGDNADMTLTICMFNLQKGFYKYLFGEIITAPFFSNTSDDIKFSSSEYFIERYISYVLGYEKSKISSLRDGNMFFTDTYFDV